MCDGASVTIYSHKVAVAMPLHVFYLKWMFEYGK